MLNAGRKILTSLFPYANDLPHDLDIFEQRRELARFAMQMKLSRPERPYFISESAVRDIFPLVRLFNRKLNHAYSMTLASIFANVVSSAVGSHDFAIFSGITAVSCHQGVMGFARDIKQVLNCD